MIDASGVGCVVYACGDNSTYTLGISGITTVYPLTRAFRDITIAPPNPSGFETLVTSWYFSICVDIYGKVWSVGTNFKGCLGIGEADESYVTQVPVQITNLPSGIIGVCTSAISNWAIDSQLRVWAWGENSEGQLGLDNTINQNIPALVTALDGAEVRYAGGNWQIGAYSTISGVYTCGINTYGQLGWSDNPSQQSTVPHLIPDTSNIYQCYVGYPITVLHYKNQSLSLCGKNEAGCFGVGYPIDAIIWYPSGIFGSGEIASVYCKGDRALGIIKTDGTLWMAGANWAGRFGIDKQGADYPTVNPENTYASFIQMSGINNANSLSIGGENCWILKNDGQLFCCGKNDDYQLGRKKADYVLIPEVMSGSFDAFAVTSHWHSFQYLSHTVIDDITFYISGCPTQINNDISLYTYNSASLSDAISLDIGGNLISESGLYCNIFGYEELGNNIDLYSEGYLISESGSYCYILGHKELNNNVDLYLIANNSLFADHSIYISGSDIRNDTFPLLITGRAALPIETCPILDPTASIQISSELIDIYQSRIDALINQLGKNILLEFDPVIALCGNCNFDPIRNRSTGMYNGTGSEPFVLGRRCPICRGKGVIETSETRCIKCLIKWNPRDYANQSIRNDKSNNIVRTKCLLSQSPWISRCRTALMNYNISNQFILRVKRIRGPIPTGLREKRYAVTWWEVIED